MLIIGMMILLVPSTSLVNAQEYYEQDQYYSYEDEQYKKADKKYYDEQYETGERKPYYNDDKRYVYDYNEKNFGDIERFDDNLFVCDNVIVVDDRTNCPIKCPYGTALEGAYVMDLQICDSKSETASKKCPAGTDLEGVFVMSNTICNIFEECNADSPLGMSLGGLEPIKVLDTQLCQLSIPDSEMSDIQICQSGLFEGFAVDNLEVCNTILENVQVCPPTSDLPGILTNNIDTCDMFTTCLADSNLGMALGNQTVKVADPNLCTLDIPEEIQLFLCTGGPMEGAVVTDDDLCEAPNSANVCPTNSDLPGVYVMDPLTQCNINILESLVICSESGFVVNNSENCPQKCPDGTYIMQGMECPPAIGQLTVNKEIYGCDSGSFPFYDCRFDNDDERWMLCDDMIENNISSASFICNPLQENDFDIEVSDNNTDLIDPPGRFEGSTEGTTIMDLVPGTYNINETIYFSDDVSQLNINTPTANSCKNTGFVDGGTIYKRENNQLYDICFEYEDENGNDCRFIELQAGDDKTCTVKNYIRSAFTPN